MLRKNGFHCEAIQKNLWLKHGQLNDVIRFVCGRDLSNGRLPMPAADAPRVTLRADLVAMDYSSAAAEALLAEARGAAGSGPLQLLRPGEPLGSHPAHVMRAALGRLEALEALEAASRQTEDAAAQVPVPAPAAQRPSPSSDGVSAEIPAPEDPAAVAAAGTRAIFAYGTLRTDFYPGGGDAWGVMPSKWQRGAGEAAPAVVYGTVRGFRMMQDLRAGYPYALKTDCMADAIRGTLLAWPAPALLEKGGNVTGTDLFYDRLQVCNLIEAHDPHGLTPSLYERCEVDVEVEKAASDGAGRTVRAYLYYMRPDPGRLQWSLVVPGGDWLQQVRDLRGDAAEDLTWPANEEAHPGAL